MTGFRKIFLLLGLSYLIFYYFISESLLKFSIALIIFLKFYSIGLTAIAYFELPLSLQHL